MKKTIQAISEGAPLSTLNGLPDASVRRVAKAVTGRPAKTREQAIENIEAARNREALMQSGLRALDETPL